MVTGWCLQNSFLPCIHTQPNNQLFTSLSTILFIYNFTSTFPSPKMKLQTLSCVFLKLLYQYCQISKNTNRTIHANQSQEEEKLLWCSLRWYFLWLDGKTCAFMDYAALGHHYAACCLIPCHSRLCMAWPHFDHLSHCTPPKAHEIYKIHTITNILYISWKTKFLFKNYTQKARLRLRLSTDSSMVVVKQTCVHLLFCDRHLHLTWVQSFPFTQRVKV